MTRPTANHAICPPPLKATEERRHMRVLGSEDCDEAMARARRDFGWAVAMVGRPVKGHLWWVFTVETERLK